MKITGKILEVKDTHQVSDTFKKRMFTLEYADNPQYPEYITFELIQDRCELIDGFQVGQEIEVSFNLKGRKWVNPEGETKYFNSLQAWRIETLAKEQSQAPEQVSATQQATTDAAIVEDELPF
ncbi:MAG: DUF3127 domain-containing protein [Bacteroidota bacterium]